MSVMSAAEARQVAGASPDIPPPRLRIATSAAGQDEPATGASPPGTGGQPAGWGHATERCASALRVTQVRVVRQVSVRTLRARGARSMTVPQPRPPEQARQAEARQAEARMAEPAARRPGTIRLTRRGRRVVAGFAIVVVIVAVTLLWMAAAGSVQASSHASPPGSAYHGMTQVVVQPGQTLWSIAAAAEPSGNSWAVVQQIIDVNALTSANVQAGELLWVPEG
jgi:nucleoid-associated protein YgaU